MRLCPRGPLPQDTLIATVRHRPEGVRLIPNADRNALVREILAVASGNTPKQEPSASVNTNILEMIDIYKDLNRPA